MPSKMYKVCLANVRPIYANKHFAAVPAANLHHDGTIFKTIRWLSATISQNEFHNRNCDIFA